MCIACDHLLLATGAPLFAEAWDPAAPRSFVRGARPAASWPLGVRRRPWPRAEAAELIFHNGVVLTADDNAPRAEAVAVRDGRIVAVGAHDLVMQTRDASTKMIDLGGYTLAPGFIDPHMHASSGIFATWLDVGPTTHANLASALDAVAGAALAAEPGAWFRGHGIDPSIMLGGVISRSRLDALAPVNPVFLMESNGHVAYVNSAAIAAAGIDESTPDPPQGRYCHDDAGALSGRLEEGPAYAVFTRLLPSPTRETYLAAISGVLERASRVGCTSLNDMGLGSSGIGEFRALKLVMDEDPPVRMTAFTAGKLSERWREEGLSPGWGDDGFRLVGQKLWSDGSNQGRSGFLREPYLGSSDRGALNYTAEELNEAVRAGLAAGWEVGVHANGDAAIDTTLDAFERGLAATERTDHRCRIEHCSILRPEQIARMAALGVSPSFLIGHVHFWGRAFRDRVLGPVRADFYDPCRSALDGGLRISLHSDYSVTPLEPLRCMENAVTRIMRDGGEVLNPAERITPHEALKAVTIDAAWQCRADHHTGSLEAGKFADLVLLEEDPTTTDPAHIKDVKVVETWLGGARRYRA